MSWLRQIFAPHKRDSRGQKPIPVTTEAQLSISKPIKVPKGQPGHFNCPLCQGESLSMLPLPVFYLENLQTHGFALSPLAFETLNVGHFLCSRCGASDRARLYALYFRQYFAQRGAVPTTLLDIAPDARLGKFLRTFPNVLIRTMDLYMEGVDDRLDITDMHPYETGRFDFIICSHVLEHIPDDKKALQELHRVLKPSGKALLMAPIHLQLNETIEDPTCQDEATRWQRFGQNDHIRLYSKDGFVERIKEAGFEISELGQDHFGAGTFQANAIFRSSVLYIAQKKPAV